MTSEENINRFIENAELASARVFRVQNEEEFRAILAETLVGASSIYCPGITNREKTLALPPDLLNSDLTRSEVCVEEVAGAIAETGSLICTSGDGRPVQAGVLATHHVALLAAGNIRESLDDYYRGLQAAPDTNITLVTGPSRTADIELTLTIGVHGPAKLTIIVY